MLHLQIQCNTSSVLLDAQCTVGAHAPVHGILVHHVLLVGMLYYIAYPISNTYCVCVIVYVVHLLVHLCIAPLHYTIYVTPYIGICIPLVPSGYATYAYAWWPVLHHAVVLHQWSIGIWCTS